MTTELGKVFVVDDEVELMSALCDVLTRQGYKAAGFSSGEEALKALEEEEVDLLLSDIMMPGMSGIELLKAALKIDPNLVGIMMTGHGSIQTAVDAMKSGALDYVLKPFRLAELVPVLSRAMEVRRLRLENVQLRETLAIYELTKAMAFSLDLNTVLNKAADAAVQQCDADESSIMLLTSDAEHLYVAATGGQRRESVLGERVRVGEGVAGWVALHREPLLLNGNNEDQWSVPVGRRADVLSSVSVPMIAGGKLVGVLNVNDNRRPRPFTFGKLKALSILASIAATALEAAELFDRVKQAEEKYRTLVEQLPAITYIVSLEKGVRPLYISPQIEKVTGISAEEWMRDPEIWTSHIHEADRERVKQEMWRRLSCEDRFVSEYRIVTSDNRTLWIHDEALMLMCKTGRTAVLQGVMVDLTHLKEAEEALRASEAMKRLLIEQSPLGIGIVQQSRLAYANPSITGIFGYDTSDAMVGLPAGDLFVSGLTELMLDGEAKRTAGKPAPGPVECRGVRQDGEAFDLQAWPKTISYQGQPAVLIFLEDTTEAKSVRAQLLQAQKMEAVGTLAGGVAHDFNNILTIVSGFSELLLSQKDPDDPDRADLLKVVTASGRGAELVKRLLTFSRKAEAYPHPLNLNNEMEEMKKLLSRAIPSMVAIDLRLAPDLKVVNADSIQIGQLLMNLVVNAQDAMPDGGEIRIETANVTLDEEYCRTHLDCSPGDYVLLSVSDTGQGMAPETLKRIFDPFFTTKEPGAGTGLGLSTVYGIVKQHNGYITCSSEPGKGTTFLVYFPVLEREHVLLKAREEKTMPPGGTETLLVVDDEEFVRDLGVKLLRRAGYTVLTAGSGAEALEVYREHRGSVSLVILDFVMPRMGGKQCLLELLKIDPDVKVVISSAYAMEDRTREILGSGAAGFVTKPFNVRELLKTIRGVLDADRSQETHASESPDSDSTYSDFHDGPAGFH